MSRLKEIDPATVTGRAKDLIDAVKGKLGTVPNMTRVMATPPAVLESYLSFSGAIADCLLDGKTREKLALLRAQEKGCDYYLSAHTAIGKMAGLKEEEILASRHGIDKDAKTATTLIFATRVMDAKGQSVLI